MSIKRKYETKKYIKTEQVMISEKRYCDICGKEITGHHWEVKRHHSDWGSESCESLEFYDVCSSACLRQMFNYYIEDSDNDINTCEIEVEHCKWSEVKGDIKYEEVEV